jgi:putative membrane protein insertion efficiency factor
MIITKMMKKIFIFLIESYQKFSKYTPRVCRFHPTCSEYTKQAVIKYGFSKGFYLGILRILKCHPFNPGGFDPIP